MVYRTAILLCGQTPGGHLLRAGAYETLKQQEDIPVATIVDGDEILTRGTQQYARDRGWHDD